MKMKIRTIIEDSETRIGRAFDVIVQTLIVLSLISFSIETLPDLSDRWPQCSGLSRSSSLRSSQSSTSCA